MGDAVNLGARLEGISKHYGVDIVAGEATRAQTPNIVYRELDRVRVKGKREAVAIYEPVDEAYKLSHSEVAELARWQEALQQYRRGEWDAAEASLRALRDAVPRRRLYTLYLERIDAMRASRDDADADAWDGVHEFDAK
jgi:adenylate cyclase